MRFDLINDTYDIGGCLPYPQMQSNHYSFSSIFISMEMVCASKLRWSTPPYRAYSYSLPSPPQTAKCYGCCIAFAAANTRLHKQFKAAENDLVQQQHHNEEEEEEEEEDFQVLTAVQTNYNRILIIDTPKSRLLLLDSCHNVHSILNKGTKWTGSYWDECATFPPVLPKGPIAIFGLGGGTSVHLMLDLWPSLQLEGWEIDGILIDKSRDYFGLHDLEKHTTGGGILNVHVGDAFSPEAAISGGYAGILVDLFAEGKVLPQLEQAATWLELYDKLMPEGRFMVNCGAGEKGLPTTNAISQDDGSSTHGTWKLNATIRALCEAFPGQVNWKKLPPGAGENYLALTGFLPDLITWSAAAPSELYSSVKQWRTCNMMGPT